MLRPFQRSVLGLVAALSMVSAAAADVTVSTSTNSTATFGSRLGSLMQAERGAAKDLDAQAMKRLTVAPESGENGPYSGSRLEKMRKPKGGENWSCLAEALYFEARGESVKGMFAVAEVILNRVDDARYPDTVCGVVNQGTGERFRCQFTYTCDGRPENIGDAQAYDRVAKVARLMMDGEERRLTDGATHYHTKSVRPKWAKVFPRTTTIGYHHFYREPSRIASR